MYVHVFNKVFPYFRIDALCLEHAGAESTGK